MFAFGSHSKGKEVERANEWRAKNVTPILYREHKRHTYLHKTLRAWAETYRDGVRGKERIVVECAIARPLTSTRQDDFISRLLWALNAPDVVPARRFAEMDPVPSLDWLEPLSEERYHHADLDRFGVPPKASVDNELAFSFIRRPSPYHLSPLMALVDGGGRSVRWDGVMYQLARWLIRHLDDPVLLLWFVKRGGQLHDDLVRLIDDRLLELTNLERDENTGQLTRIRKNAPNAIPRPLMITLWRLLLSGRVKSMSRKFDLDLYRWRERFKREGLTTALRLELKEMLTPRVSLREQVNWPPEEHKNRKPERINDLVDWGIVLSTVNAHSILADLAVNELWIAALPTLLTDFSALLRDALDLMRELGGADDKNDTSYIHQPSISKHSQNKNFYDWTVLIDLNRDAWLATSERCPDQAIRIAESWLDTPYPIFRRLAFYAATQGNLVPHEQALDWLLDDDNWWLWSVETERETMRLLISLAPHLKSDQLNRLEVAILEGPPRSMFRENIESEQMGRIFDREIWLRLAKIVETGVVLRADASKRLESLSAQYPEWKLAADQRDEFPYWMESSWGGNHDPWRDFVSIPRRRKGLLNYVIENPVLSPSKQDDWRKRCEDSFQSTAYALCYMARNDVWPHERWRDALHVWTAEGLQKRAWQYMASVLVKAPDEVFECIVHALSWWLEAVSKTFEGNERVPVLFVLSLAVS